MTANALELVGKVRNLGDGRVEVIALGADEDVADLEGAIERGPSRSKVERVEKTEVSEEAQDRTLSPADRLEFRVVTDGGEPWEIKS